MNINLIEQDLTRKQQTMMLRKAELSSLKGNPKVKKDSIRLVEQEIFFLKDQIKGYKTLFNLLKDDQESYEFELPKTY